jgi:hypothetical protein
MMRRKINHWPFWITGPVLAVFLIIFWYGNQAFLAQEKNPVTVLLENPLLTFGFIFTGAFLSAMAGGEFSIKLPATVGPLAFAFTGGVVMGVGSILAAMSVHSVVLFNLAGVFTLTAFMVTKGWVYAVFMILGGWVGSKFFAYLILKNMALKHAFVLPAVLRCEKNQRIVFGSLFIVFLLFIIAVVLMAHLAAPLKSAFISAIVALVAFGVIVERGRVCMSSMVKEWFLAKNAYVWRTILFTIMCLGLVYQTGLAQGFYAPIAVEAQISHLAWLVFGSFLMGVGFVFADGCFIGSLWKSGQGNVINIVGIFGILLGTGLTQVVIKLLPAQNAVSSLSNNMIDFISPFWFLLLLWIAGVTLFICFKPIHYDY